jgi:tetratricopeptide (TPR) repeat protein
MLDSDGGELHPSPHDLERFLLGDMPHEEVNGVIAHLMRGCAECRSRMAPLAAALFGRVAARGTTPVDATGEPYDAVLDRVFSGARDYAKGVEADGGEAAGHPSAAVLDDEVAWRPRGASAQAARDEERCRALLERCVDLRHRDAEALVLTATLAVNLAERLEPVHRTAGEIADLRARSWAELGNALRIADDLTGAESALARSLELSGDGTGDPLLLARQMDLAASLLKDRRRFEEARSLLDCARRIYERMGDDQAAARTLISQGIAASVALESASAVQLLGEGLRKIDPERDPRLALASIHTLIWSLVDCGDLTLARRLFAISRDLYATAGGQLFDLRGRWLEGRIAAGLGDDGAAERALREVRQRFEDANLHYDAALVTLDLVEVLLHKGERREIESLLDATTAVFRARQIGRETLTSLLMLRQVTAENRLTASVLRQVARDMREQGPEGALEARTAPS